MRYPRRPCSFPGCPSDATRRFLVGSRCVDHTPARIAGRPENRPDPDSTLRALRARNLPVTNRGDRYGAAGPESDAD